MKNYEKYDIHSHIKCGTVVQNVNTSKQERTSNASIIYLNERTVKQKVNCKK